MPKILFTKKLDLQEISKIFGGEWKVECEEVLLFFYSSIAPVKLQQKNLIFTSVNGVKGFVKNLVAKDDIIDCHFYCVGNRTEQYLHEHGFSVQTSKKNAKELADFLIENNINHNIHFCGNLVLPTLENRLKEAGLQYEKIEVYHTQLLYPIIEKKYDALVFFSPSGVESFVKNNSIEKEMIFAIGQTTTKSLQNYTNNPIFTAEKENIEDLLTLIQKTML